MDHPALRICSNTRVLQYHGTWSGNFQPPVSMSDIATRDTVCTIMHEHFPEGFDKRFPGRNKPTIPRTPLRSSGPFHEISADGHEKLSELALHMGDIGIPIYGFKDKWSDVVLKLVCIPNCRTLGPIAHLYLDLVEEQGGMFLICISELCLTHSSKEFLFNWQQTKELRQG